MSLEHQEILCSVHLKQKIYMKDLFKNNPQFIGIFSALCCAITWVFAAIFMSNIYKTPEIAQIESSALPFAVTFLYGAAGAIAILIFLAFIGKMPEFKRSLFTKSSRILWMSGSFGGPLAVVFFSIAIKNLDPAYVMPITSSYPVLCGLLAMFFLSEKINLKGWLGILIVIAGAVLVGLQPPSSQSTETFYLGVFFALATAIAWSLEAVLASKGVDYFDPYIATAFRFMAFLVVCPTLIMPIFGGFEYILPLLQHAFVYVFLAGFLSFVNCMFYYVGIAYIGSARTAAITSSYSLFSILAGFILGTIEFSLVLSLGGITLFTGVLVIVASSSSGSFREKKEDAPIAHADIAPITNKIPIKAAIVSTLVNTDGKNAKEISDILLKIYNNENQASEKHVQQHLEAMKMAGLVELKEKSEENIYTITTSGIEKLVAFS